MPASLVQERLLEFLGKPGSYPHGPGHVEVIQTHISVVAIATPFVFKIRKPVEMGFLDFSTLELRRLDCVREVELNRRLCNDIYLGVTPILSTDSGLAFGKVGKIGASPVDRPPEQQGTVVEWAVKMNELDADFFLDRLVDSGRAEKGHVDEVVHVLKTFYRNQSSTPGVAKWGAVERIRMSTNENFEQTERFVGHLLQPYAFEAIRLFTDDSLDRRGHLFEKRQAEGRIVDCHGDLRLEHVSLVPGRTCIFDCIEFNDRLRFIDIANDIAFLAMDFDFSGRPDLSEYLVDRMAAELDDPGLHHVIDFYKCYRAYVRGKVEGFRSSETEVPAEERRESRIRARQFFRLALRYATAGSGASVLAVMGPAGVGKSSIAHALGNAFDVEVFSSDRIRKENAGIPLDYRGTDEERADLYSRAKTDRVYGELIRQTIDRSQKSIPTIVDATFGRRRLRERFSRAMQSENIRHLFVELRASEDVIKERLRIRNDAEGEISDARLSDYPMLASRFEPPGEEGIPIIRIDTAVEMDQSLLAFLLGLIAKTSGP